MHTTSFTQSRIRNRNHTPSGDSAFTNLLVRYMDGQIADRSWEQIMKSIDQSGLTGMERVAFAKFMTEVMDDSTSLDLHLPKPEEVEEIMSVVRISGSKTKN